MRAFAPSLFLAIASASMMLPGQDRGTTALPSFLAKEFQEGINAQRENDLTTAIQKYEDVVTRLPAFLPAWFNMGLVWDQRGDFDKALRCFEEVSRQAPEHPNASLFTGIEMVKLNRPEQAIPILTEASKRGPEEKQNWFWLARAHLLLHQHGEALDAARQAEKASPDDPSVQFQIALIYIDNQHWRDAEQILRGIVNAHPTLPHVHSALAQVYYTEGRSDEALAEYKSEPQIEPDNLQDKAMAGMILCDRGAYAEAIPYLSAASQKSANNPAVELKFAEALWHQNQVDMALPHAENAVKLEPSNPTTHFILSKIYAAGGHNALADRELQSFKTLLNKEGRP